MSMLSNPPRPLRGLSLYTFSYMIIRMYPIPPQRGNERLAQGIALGKCVRQTRPVRVKACISQLPAYYTQGDALGYVRVGLSGRLSGTCG